MNYRPEGWNKVRELFAETNGGGYAEKTAALEDMEAGADAMLEGLRKGATRVNNLGDPPQGKGVIVFIPEEE